MKRSTEHKQSANSPVVSTLETFLTVGAAITLAAGAIAENLHTNPWLATLFYTLCYLSGGYQGTIGGIQSLMRREIDVDILMVLAALGAAYIGAPFEGGMLLFLFALSNLLQDIAMARSGNAIHALMKLRPSEVTCMRNGNWQRCPVDSVQVGELVQLKPGENIALDGAIEHGEGDVDESSLTGESMPVRKAHGSALFAGTLNLSASMDYRVTRAAGESTLDKIVQLVEKAQNQKAASQSFLEKAEQRYALGVILLTLGLILLPPLLSGADFAASFYRAMTVMVVASPCALVISTPAAFLSAIGGAARMGVLFKGGIFLEKMASVKVIAIDKTGTLTQGKPKVVEIRPYPATAETAATPEHRLLQLAAAVEQRSEHPIAKAIEQARAERSITALESKSFTSITGKGATAQVEGITYLIGSPKLFKERIQSDPANQHHTWIEGLEDRPCTWVILGAIPASKTGPIRILGAIGIADPIRPESAAALKQLRKLGIEHIAMLTGDNPVVAQALGKEAGVDAVHASLLPEDKVKVIRQLQAKGPVAMVGDGINDAPALASANVGIAMGAAGTDIALESADLVLMGSQLQAIGKALALAKKTRSIVIQNLSFALAVILVLVSLALTVGITLPIGVVGHEGSTVLVCLNGLRLLFYRPD
jgi:Cd2+/Zn2+-exporting ATPase